jgi:phytoene dehydrogenase-like protein
MHLENAADGPPVVIVGAGVAGLTCATALARAGRRVLVLEREHAVGGRVRSRSVDGYTVDRGFQVLFTAYPTLAAALGLRDDGGDGARRLALRRFAPAARLVTARGASLVGDALRDPRLLAPTVLAGALSPADKLRLLALRRLATSLSVDACFAPAYDAVPARDFLRARGLSARAVSRFFAPFYGGILLDPALGTSAAVLLFTFKMLAEGDTVVPAGGMGDVARRLAEQLPAGAVRTGVAVDAVLADGGRAAGVRTGDGATIAAADVVLAVEAPAARRLAATAGAELAVPSGALGCTTVWFAAGGGAPPLPGRAIWLNAAGHELAGAGGADARDDAAPAVSHAVTMTEVAPEYAAPDARHGRHLVAATAVGAPAEVADDRLVPRMRAELAAMRRAAALDDGPALVPVAVERVPYAQFAQPPGARARRTPATGGLAGLWRASETAHSSSLEGAARGGTLAAQAVLAQPVL